MHDDVVAVEVLPQQEWAMPFSLVIDDKDDDQGDLVIEQVRERICSCDKTRHAVVHHLQEETGLVVPGVSSKKTASCRIVAIIKRNWRQYCGILQESIHGVRQWSAFS